MNFLVLILLGILLIAMNAFFVVSEFSLLRIRKTRLSKLFDSNAWGTESLQKIMKNLNFYIISSQVGITTSTLSLGYLAQLYLSAILGDELTSSGNWEGLLRVVIFFVSLLIVTFFHSVFGEIAPKILAIQHVEATALKIAPILYWISFLFMPVTSFYRRSSIFILRIFNINTVTELYSRVYSEDELKLIIAQSQEQGEIDESEGVLINRILDFTDTRVNEIFTPRYDIVAFDAETQVNEIIDKARETGFSRFPLYEEKLDQVVGFVHVKDLLIANFQDPNFSIREVMRPVFTIHEAMRLDLLLKRMQQDRSQVAIVVDEYGSVEGIVTIEDILEAIVGPIDDEFDIESVELVKKIGKNKYEVDGRITIDVFNQAFQCNLQSDDSVTLAGFLIENFENVPQEGSSLSHEGEYAELEFRVNNMDGNRVEKTEVLFKKRIKRPEGAFSNTDLPIDNVEID